MIVPGSSAFTRTPCGARSTCIDFVSASTAPFDAIRRALEIGRDDRRPLRCEQLGARAADARAGARDDADLPREPHGQARTEPRARASARAIRMMAPLTASIQNVDVFRSTSTS